MQDVLTATLRIYKWPSQAFWRYFEVQALRAIPCKRPIIEIGCGDGQFSSLIFQRIDEGIDINPRSVAKCRSVSGQLYQRVRCMDVRELAFEGGGFATVYANCVLEHVSGIDKVLAGCFRGLRPGGKLIITIPLARMNHHLLFPWCWYARMRQRQLAHANLLSEESWKELLLSVGFSDIQFRPYLSGKACKFWDTIDFPGCAGFGRYRVATIVGRLSQVLLPRVARAWLLHRLASWLSMVAMDEEMEESACAAVLIATKDSDGSSP